MSDFHQQGPVTALPRLVARPIEELEADILRLSRKFPVSLVIPMNRLFGTPFPAS
jgi:glucosyl-3-phosphoglycerate synthase